MEEFVRQTIKEHEKEVDEIWELQKILEHLTETRRTRIYSITVTSNT